MELNVERDVKLNNPDTTSLPSKKKNPHFMLRVVDRTYVLFG